MTNFDDDTGKVTIETRERDGEYAISISIEHGPVIMAVALSIDEAKAIEFNLHEAIRAALEKK